MKIYFLVFASLILIFSSELQSSRADEVIEMAITVDDLPSHGALPVGMTRLHVVQKFIEAFKKHEIKNVYGFVIGKRLDDKPELGAIVKEWTSAGFSLGNHTYAHINYENVSQAEFEENILMNDTVLKTFAGISEYKWFRFPFLAEGKSIAQRESIRSFLTSQGYRNSQVTVDFRDYSWNQPFSRCSFLDAGTSMDWLRKTYIDSAVGQLQRSIAMGKTLYARQVKHTLLLHLGSFDAVMLDDLLTAYKQMGVRFISLEEAHSDVIYSKTLNGQIRGQRNFLDQLMVEQNVMPPDSHLEPLAELEELCQE